MYIVNDTFSMNAVYSCVRESRPEVVSKAALLLVVSIIRRWSRVVVLPKYILCYRSLPPSHKGVNREYILCYDIVFTVKIQNFAFSQKQMWRCPWHHKMLWVNLLLT